MARQTRRGTEQKRLGIGGQTSDHRCDQGGCCKRAIVIIRGVPLCGAHKGEALTADPAKQFQTPAPHLA